MANPIEVKYDKQYSFARFICGALIYLAVLIAVVSLMVITNVAYIEPAVMMAGIALSLIVPIFLIAFSQFLKATLDTADYNRMAVIQREKILSK